MDGTVYGDRGYAGMFWFAYDPGCTSATASTLLDQTGSTAFDSSGASADTQFGNILLKGAKLQLAGATGMRARALDQDYFTGLDSIVATGVDAIRTAADHPVDRPAHGPVGAAAAGPGPARAGLRERPTGRGGHGRPAHHRVPGHLPAGRRQHRRPENRGTPTTVRPRVPVQTARRVTPSVSYCQYDLTQFDKPPEWDENGNQLIAGTACTITYRPTLNPADNSPPAKTESIRNYTPTYFDDFYFPEVMVENLIFPYWQQGLLGTNDRAGPNYELAKQFLRGQSVTRIRAGAERL